MTKNDSEPDYPMVNGVVLKPGAWVFCDDRDNFAYDMEGVILAAEKSFGEWEFFVDFSPDAGKKKRANGEGHRLHIDQLSPTKEELEKPEAKAWRVRHRLKEELEKPKAKAQRAAGRLKVFLCHASEDKPKVRSLYRKLKGDGFNPWLDEEDIHPGADWNVEIEDAVRKCHIVLACLSNSSIAKTGYVQKEIKFALDRADEKPEGLRYIIPCRMEDCSLPRRLSQWQAVDLFKKGGYQKLKGVLTKHASELKL